VGDRGGWNCPDLQTLESRRQPALCATDLASAWTMSMMAWVWSSGPLSSIWGAAPPNNTKQLANHVNNPKKCYRFVLEQLCPFRGKSQFLPQTQAVMGCVWILFLKNVSHCR
jgi:hypothetical protein